jgi:SPP1 gp7 family putative phage head morphogenesis protein
MESKLTRFLRSGGGGEIVIGRRATPWDKGRSALCRKSGIPDAAALRDSFTARLDAVIAANAAMLRDSLAGRPGPTPSAAPMPDVSAAREHTLALWDGRIAVIWDEWHGQPHRLTPARAAMEAHLLRAFAALINELRQRALGIRQYVWRTRDDDRVRSSHAAHDNKVFSWDDPPEGGHPGQAWGCRCHAEPWFGQDVEAGRAWDGFVFRYGDADRSQILRNSEAEMRALAPAIWALATLPEKTAAQQAQQLALANAFREAAYRFELASREPGGLARSGLLFGPAAEQARMIAEAEAYRKGADDMARGMARSPVFAGVVPADVLADLRRSAPDAAGAYLNGLALLAGVAHLPEDYLPEKYRDATLRALGAGFVASARAVEQDRWGGRPLLYRGDVAQWDALHAELQGIAGQGVSPRDARSVQDGIYEETGRQFLPDTLSLLAGGLFGAVGTAARAPIRITPDILDDAGRFLGQRNAGANAPLFSSWLSKADNLAEIMPGGQLRYTTTITDPASSLNGRSVSVSYTEGFPDFSPFMTHPSGVRSVTIEMTGTNRIDFRRANRAAGHPEWGNRPPPGWTWHHNQNGTEMELIPSTINATFSHIGGAALVRKEK